MTDLGIERPQYAALTTPDPERAARFATDVMGFTVAHVDSAGRHYLRGHGADAFSLVYGPGDHGIDHLGYLVATRETLDRAHAALDEQAVEARLDESPDIWAGAPALSFRTPAGFVLRLTTGTDVRAPMAATTPEPERVPGPICCDHIVPRTPHMEQEMAFAERVLGLRLSAQIVAPGAGAVIAFYRGSLLFHCLAVARSSSTGLHHVQFTVKSPLHLYAAVERIREAGGEIIWGPVRHGPGHNIAVYFRDGAGNFVEYSCEEEVIFDDASYQPREWSAADQKSMDEWGSQPPSVFFT